MMASNTNQGNVVIDADPNYNNPNYNNTTTVVNQPAVYNNSGVGISGNIISTAPILTLISLFTFITALAWFIVELIIVCVSQGSFSNYSYIAPESAQTLQMYMYAILLAVFAYGASWYAHIQRTRAARHLAVFASIFCLFAWLWQLYYVIPSLRGKNDSSNYYCAGYNSDIDSGDIASNSATNSANRYCYLSQAAASLSVILGFALALDVLWSLFTALTSITPEVPIPTRTTVLAPINSGVNVVDAGYDDYRTELTEPDDLELMKVSVNKPNVYESIRSRMNVHSYFTWYVNLLTLAGWIVLTCATIQLSKDIGLFAYDNTTSNDQRWGDPIISTLWFPLTVTVGMTIAASAYSSFRMNRAVTASALFICFICGLQWWSFFIYSARRFQQANNAYGLSYFTDKAAQRAMVAGGGIIMCAETIKFFILTIRYLTYMPITRAEHDAIHVPSHVDAPTVIIADKDEFKNGMQQGVDQPVNVPGPAAHQLDANGQPTINTERDDTMMWHPSYNLPIMAGTSYFFRFIFYFQVLVLLAFWGNEFVNSCNSGLFTGNGSYTNTAGTTGTSGSATTNTAYSPEINFYFNEILFIYQTVLILAAWLAMFRAERESSVAASVAAVFVTTVAVAGWFLLIWPTAYQSLPNVGVLEASACTQGGGDWCRLTRAAAIFSYVVLFCLGLVWMNSLIRLAERHRLNVMERGIEHIPSSIGVLMLAGILIWGFTTIKIGLTNDNFYAQQQSQEPSNLGVSLEESYWASQVFLILVILTVASWVGTYSTKSLYAWQSWFNRLNSWMWSCLLVSVLLPFFVLTCRFIHSQSLDSVHLAVASGIIILFAGAVLYHASILFLCLESYYTVGPAGAAVPPQGLVANVGPYAADKYGLSVPTKAVPAGAAYSTTQPAYSTTVNSVNAPIVASNVEMQPSNVQYGQVPVVEERAY